MEHNTIHHSSRVKHLAATLLAGAFALSAMAGQASAMVTELVRYKLGEPGTILGGLPQDSVGGHHFQNNFGTQSVIAPGAPTNGSTAANSYNGDGGSFFTAGGTTVIPTDNFVVELWARNDNASQPSPALLTDLFTTGGGVGSLRFHSHSNGNWAASLDNINWIGGADGSGQPITEDEWTNLAVIRSNGVLTFYINGIAQAGTINSVPVINPATFHLGVRPGGLTAFSGDLDEIRIFSFDPNNDNPVAALSVNFIPEPATATLAMLGMGVLLRRRRHA